MTTLLYSKAIENEYSKCADIINKITNEKNVRKRTMKGLLQESFFHGASRFGDNFIA